MSAVCISNKEEAKNYNIKPDLIIAFQIAV